MRSRRLTHLPVESGKRGGPAVHLAAAAGRLRGVRHILSDFLADNLD
jgi:hypothetical protein